MKTNEKPTFWKTIWGAISVLVIFASLGMLLGTTTGFAVLIYRTLLSIFGY